MKEIDDETFCRRDLMSTNITRISIPGGEEMAYAQMLVGDLQRK